jgi:hypothetical protein
MLSCAVFFLLSIEIHFRVTTERIPDEIACIWIEIEADGVQNPRNSKNSLILRTKCDIMEAGKYEQLVRLKDSHRGKWEIQQHVRPSLVF